MREGKQTSNEHKSIVVVSCDGTAGVVEVSDPKKVFEEAKKIIGCDTLDYFVFRTFNSYVSLVALVNDNGYADWQDDISKVNKIGTYLYANPDGHLILGDIVLLWLINSPDGADFVPFASETAYRIATITNTKVKQKAEKEVEIPDKIPEPQIKIVPFEF